MRVMLGANIMLALIDGVLSRAQYDFPLESFAVWPGSLGTVFSAVGQKAKQQFIQTFDFSVLSLLLAAVATTIKFPHKLAFIIIHTDQYGPPASRPAPRPASYALLPNLTPTLTQVRRRRRAGQRGGALPLQDAVPPRARRHRPAEDRWPSQLQR